MEPDSRRGAKDQEFRTGHRLVARREIAMMGNRIELSRHRPTTDCQVDALDFLFLASFSRTLWAAFLLMSDVHFGQWDIICSVIE